MLSESVLQGLSATAIVIGIDLLFATSASAASALTAFFAHAPAAPGTTTAEVGIAGSSIGASPTPAWATASTRATLAPERTYRDLPVGDNPHRRGRPGDYLDRG